MRLHHGLERFLAEDAPGRHLSAGWHVRLQFLRRGGPGEIAPPYTAGRLRGADAYPAGRLPSHRRECACSMSHVSMSR